MYVCHMAKYKGQLMWEFQMGICLPCALGIF